MPEKKRQLYRFLGLTWNDIAAWASGKIASRGKSYQRQGRVADLAITDDGSLIAWVDGSERYATKVVIDEDGLPDSICTCPYQCDCKHGVAVVIEYLKRVENNQSVSKAKQDDDRLKLWADDDWDGAPHEAENTGAGDTRQEFDDFLQGKTKAQLIDRDPSPGQ